MGLGREKSMGKKDRPQGSARNSSHYVRLSGLFPTSKHHSWEELEKGTGARLAGKQRKEGSKC